MTAVYDGPAAMRVDEVSHPVRVRLTGHMDPIDGKYHWRGMVFELTAAVKLPKQVAVTIGERTADAHLTEITPWGTHAIAGVGAPPYPLDQDA
ncbi:DUF4873 domain-containing protein [Mycobacterium sp. 3519A]|uniref:DUF4873 domain-containing protein n=1 Tax=Mycobacterium sp. 3519A TaxID=2057184 RepID=UPI000C7C08B8|nr:DUF4873 domain-containing protein [Mycobacterium sp. 3519A]